MIDIFAALGWLWDKRCHWKLSYKRFNYKHGVVELTLLNKGKPITLEYLPPDEIEITLSDTKLPDSGSVIVIKLLLWEHQKILDTDALKRLRINNTYGKSIGITKKDIARIQREIKSYGSQGELGTPPKNWSKQIMTDKRWKPLHIANEDYWKKQKK